MNAVWKYTLDVVDEQEIGTPAVWKPLHVQHQNGELTLWAEVDPAMPMITRSIVIIGTGHPFDSEGLTHIGSAVDPDRTLVWHVYI